MVMENWNGEMDEYIKDIGKMENNMVKGLLFTITKLEKVYGKMDNQLSGAKVKYYNNNNDIL